MTNPKFYIANRYTNRISHRALTPFERRNPAMFEMGHSAHDTCAEAIRWLIQQCEVNVNKQRKELARAELRLKRARWLDMQTQAIKLRSPEQVARMERARGLNGR